MREKRITKAWLARTNKRKETEKEGFVNEEQTKVYSWFLLLGTNVVILKKEKKYIN